MQNRDLPIYEIRTPLLAALRTHARLIIEAPTGSGKSTQVSQMLVDGGLAGEGQVVVLQPRRIAARMLAARVASERDTRLGDEVGYQIRFQDCSSRRTRIKYVTEGVLLRQMLARPRLDGISTVVFDEFHERHLYGDVTLGQALRIQQALRPDLKIIIMSATLDAENLQGRLQPCAVVRSAGRTYPVRVEYLARPVDEKTTQVWDVAAREFERLIPEVPEGDVLVFMPGAYEIGRTLQRLAASPAARGMRVLPLHGELSEADQDRAVMPADQRKIVVATNVAETSLTIDGIRLVIDSGLARVPRFDSYRGINTLLTEKISGDSADQRTGRAGRTAPGRCIRLWTEAQHRERPPKIIPEVLRLDLSEVLLTLMASSSALPELTRNNVAENFPWLDRPDARALERALDLLADLGAISLADGRITDTGQRMAALPMHPRFARMLLAAGEFGCVRTAALIAALTQERTLLTRRPDEVTRQQRDHRMDDESASDFFPLMQAWSYAREHDFDLEDCRRLGIHAQTARRVGQNWQSFLRIAEAEGMPAGPDSGDDEAVQMCLLMGFSDHLARRLHDGTMRCNLVHRRAGTLDKESVVRRWDLLVAAEIHEREVQKNKVDVMLSLCTGVKEEWLRRFFPDDFSTARSVEFDAAAKRVVAQANMVFRGLVIASKTVPPTDDEAAHLLADEVSKGNLTLKNWNHSVEQWIWRVDILARACPDLGIQPVTDEDIRHMVEQVCHGAESYKDIKERPVLAVVKNWLSPAQLALVDKWVPERLKLSNGRTPKLNYVKEGAPYIETRIQELYDVTRLPALAMGRVAVVVHILAPNSRPVQITEDLARFWREQYPVVKKELQRRYPKHEWR